MDFAEFWVLDTAVESCISLRTISGGDHYLRFQWNKPPHGLVHERLVQLMVRLADTGYVEFYLDYDPVTATAAEISMHWRLRATSSANPENSDIA